MTKQVSYGFCGFTIEVKTFEGARRACGWVTQIASTHSNGIPPQITIIPFPAPEGGRGMHVILWAPVGEHADIILSSCDHDEN